MAFGAEQDAARYVCRRCGDCPGQEHHWLQPDHDPKTDRSFVPCKHCAAEAQLCEECFGCAVWPTSAVDVPLCADCRAAGEDTFIAECASRCRCCTTCHQPYPCAGVMQGASCDGMCRCDEDSDDRYDEQPGHRLLTTETKRP